LLGTATEPPAPVAICPRRAVDESGRAGTHPRRTGGGGTPAFRVAGAGPCLVSGGRSSLRSRNEVRRAGGLGGGVAGARLPVSPVVFHPVVRTRISCAGTGVAGRPRATAWAGPGGPFDSSVDLSRFCQCAPNCKTRPPLPPPRPSPFPASQRALLPHARAAPAAPPVWQNRPVCPPPTSLCQPSAQRFAKPRDASAAGSPPVRRVPPIPRREPAYPTPQEVPMPHPPARRWPPARAPPRSPSSRRRRSRAGRRWTDKVARAKCTTETPAGHRPMVTVRMKRRIRPPICCHK
jgi:hypothetical protein